jgi:hypothetical protein
MRSLPHCRRILSVLFASVICSLASSQEPAPGSIFTAARNGVAARRTDRTALLGFGIARNKIDEINVKGGILIGFDVGVRGPAKREIITALRPIYRTASGLSYGRAYGRFSNTLANGKRAAKDRTVRVVELRARAGLAVGGIKMRTGLGIDGLALHYHRITGDRLEETPTSRSAWVGNEVGGSPNELSTRGQPIVGVIGHLNDGGDAVIALGFLHLKVAPTPTPDVVVPPPPEPVARREKPVEKPAPAPPQEKEAPPPPPPPEPALPVRPEGNKHHDANGHYTLALPEGWRAMTADELATINAFFQKHGAKETNYTAGFHPVIRQGNYPHVLVKIQPLNTRKMNYQQIEKTIPCELPDPIQHAEGTFAEIVAKLEPGSAVRTGNRVIVRKQFESPATGKVQTINVVHIGDQALLTLHGSALDRTFAEQLPTFIRLNDSFVFDAGFQYKPPVEQPAAENSSFPAWMPLAVFAGVSGVIFLPLMFILGRRKGGELREKKQTEVESAKPAPTHDARSSTSQPRTRDAHGALVYFTVTARIAFQGTKSFRIYVRPDDLLILDAAPSNRLHAADEEHLERLAKGGANVRALIDETSARIEAPSWWQARSGAQGVLRVRVLHEKERTFQFANIEEMKKAIEMLGDALGESLFVNVVFDRRAGRYVCRS